MNLNPIRGKLVLPTDCYDLTSFEWSEVPPTLAATPKAKSFADFEKSVAIVVLPAPVEFKSLAESFGDLVSAVRSFRRPTSPLASVFSK
jgi:hypothetical protein